MGFEDLSDQDNNVYQKRFITPPSSQIFIWRGSGSDEFIPYTIHDLKTNQSEAYALDADSLEKGDGIKLTIDENDDTAIMISERPILIKAYTTDLQKKVSLYFQSLTLRLSGSGRCRITASGLKLRSP